MGAQGGRSCVCGGDSPDLRHPVEQISWLDCREWLAFIDSFSQTDVVGATFVGDTLWITKWGARQVGKFDPGTNTFTSKFSTSTNAGGLAYDPGHDILWVGQQGGTVEAWDLHLGVSPPTVIAGSGFQPLGAISQTVDGLAFIGGLGADAQQSQLVALFQAGSGAGQTIPGFPAADIPAGQKANFRDGALKLYLLWSNSDFHIAGDAGDAITYPGPDFPTAVGALGGAKVAGISTGGGGLTNLKQMAVDTGALAPPGGVDCDGDGIVDIFEGEPLVCPTPVVVENIVEVIVSVVEAILPKLASVQINKAEVEWQKGKLKVNGVIVLPPDESPSTVGALGSVSIDLATLGLVVNTSVALDVLGGNGEKWEFKNKTAPIGLRKFKINWKDTRFEFKEGIHIKSGHLGHDATTLEIEREDVVGAFTIEIGGVTITVDAVDMVTVSSTDVIVDVDDDGEVEVDLPFALTPEMTMILSGAVTATVAVADHLTPGTGKFQIEAAFDPMGTDGTQPPSELLLLFELGDDRLPGSAAIGSSDWVRLTAKEWKFKR